jgi:hypothetical protein
MAITLTLPMFHLCPLHEKSGGCFPHLASHSTEGPDEPPRLASMWSNSQGASMPGAVHCSEPCGCLYFVMASWGGALGLNHRVNDRLGKDWVVRTTPGDETTKISWKAVRVTAGADVGPRQDACRRLHPDKRHVSFALETFITWWLARLWRHTMHHDQRGNAEEKRRATECMSGVNLSIRHGMSCFLHTHALRFDLITPNK